jgi:hypothetical protein
MRWRVYELSGGSGDSSNDMAKLVQKMRWIKGEKVNKPRGAEAKARNGDGGKKTGATEAYLTLTASWY